MRSNGAVAPLRDVTRGAPTVLAFWATYCPPCRAEVPALNRAVEKWRARGLHVVGVSLDDDSRRSSDSREAWGMRYDVVRVAPDQDALVEQLLPRGLPTSALVVRETVTWYEHLLTDEALDRLVPKLLDGQ